MARPTIDVDVAGETFEFHVGRISGEGTFDLDALTFSITEAAVELPNGDTRSLPIVDHFIEVPIPPPVLDFILI
jgi:hypothetical protein